MFGSITTKHFYVNAKRFMENLCLCSLNKKVKSCKLTKFYQHR